MSDVDNNVIALMVLQEENKQLEDSLKKLGGAFKSLGSINQMLELENKQLKNKLNEIEQVVSEWNENASHSFDDMCKINKILKE